MAVSFVSAGEVWEWAGRNYQWSLSQKIECHCGEQEGSGCQQPEERDLTSQLRLSVTLSSR